MAKYQKKSSSDSSTKVAKGSSNKKATKRANAGGVTKQSKAKKGKAKKAKDPNAPKRPSNAYIHYCKKVRSDVKAANPNLKPTEINQKMGEQWKNLSDEEKAPFEKLVEKDKLRYQQEMANYVPPEPTDDDDAADDDDDDQAE